MSQELNGWLMGITTPPSTIPLPWPEGNEIGSKPYKTVMECG